MIEGISYIDIQNIDDDKQWSILCEPVAGGPKCVHPEARDCECCALRDSCPGPEGAAVTYRVAKLVPIEQLLEWAKEHDE